MSLTAEQVIEVVEEVCRDLAIEREKHHHSNEGVDMFGLGMQYTIHTITNKLHALSSVQEQYKELSDANTEG